MKFTIIEKVNNMEKEMRFCQSCGMPLTDDVLGTNADGSKNEEYCIYCYKDGAFTGDFTMEEMAEFCTQFVDEYNKNTGQNLTREEYKLMLLQYYPSLKRWQLPAEELPHATSPLKQQLIEEINALGIKDMPHVENLFVLQGSFVNMAYPVNGNIQTELDCIVNQYTNQFCNPMVMWGKYRKGLFKTTLPVSFQFHHVQMDGGHAAKFFANLQKEINRI